MANELSETNDSAPELNRVAAIQSAFCGSLRSKKFFMLDTLATEPEQYLDASNHCWCRETQQVIGPDNGRVNPTRCVPGRECYSSALESV
ncbi:MAG TPA: hypothetical protein VMS31_19100 [Pyrinomonadaceae bacterium]|nr:hypothetical protein [Pyrinomonadaceae bacterium]